METTWKRPETSRGVQADLSYYFKPVKIRAESEAHLRKSNDIADYPNPDLAIEIDLSDPKVDRPGIYAKLNVAEIWRFDGENVFIEQLQEDGSYALAESSRFLPIRAEDVRRWLVDEDSGSELAWERRLGEWAAGIGSPVLILMNAPLESLWLQGEPQSCQLVNTRSHTRPCADPTRRSTRPVRCRSGSPGSRRTRRGPRPDDGPWPRAAAGLPRRSPTRAPTVPPPLAGCPVGSDEPK